MKISLIWFGLLLLSACTHAPIISNPSEGPNDKPAGDVTALSEQLKNRTEAVLIFVHGVGDHCPGYALDEQFGWLSAASLKHMHLTPQPGASSKPVDIYDNEFLPDHPLDTASKVSYWKREFVYQTAAPDAHAVAVHAIEITWSQLTQWVKTNQLGYDLTEPMDPVPSETQGCPYPASDQSYKKPPSRELFNRILKESVLDRSLADAVLYAGEYGRVMRRGVAEALCLAMGGTGGITVGTLCQWPATSQASTAEQPAFFFVTHSLGSRLVYDTLLCLTSTQECPTTQTFTPSEITAAAPFVSNLMVQTASVYMMANQLPLLGLAYEDGTRSSSDGPVSQALMRVQPLIAPKSDALAPVVAPKVAANAMRTRPSVNAFAQKRMQTAQDQGKQVPTLKVVAFSDPNDLLSWGIPKWYQQDPSEGKPAVRFTNVFLPNSTHWFGLVENPATAHEHYFENSHVWQVVQCGAAAGQENPC